MPPDVEHKTETVPIYRYALTLKDGTTRSVDAMGYVLDAPWMIFDDTESTTVLTIREELVNEVARGEQVGEQVVDAL